jgi:hypothetical protein
MAQKTIDIDPFSTHSVFGKTYRRTHSGLAIVIAAIYDNKLEQCLRLAMPPMTKKLYNELFDSMHGALGSFANKITMAYALKIITSDIYSDLNKIRKIRNTFAHSKDILSFESESIAPLLRQLNKSVQVKANRLDLQFLECLTPVDEALDAYLKSKGAQAS